MAKRKLSGRKSTTSKPKEPLQDKLISLSPKKPGWNVDEVSEEASEQYSSSDPLLQKYPPPKTNSLFVAKWEEYLPGIVGRSNFKLAHLHQLAILCDLYLEYDKLSKFVSVKGYTYVSVGRNGRQYKHYPEVSMLFRVHAEIRNYSRMLGLILSKDTDIKSGAEKSEWE